MLPDSTTWKMKNRSHPRDLDRAGRHGNVALDSADLVLNQGLLGTLQALRKTAKDSVLGLERQTVGWTTAGAGAPVKTGKKTQCSKQKETK
jgi:hypothetical protein